MLRFIKSRINFTSYNNRDCLSVYIESITYLFVCNLSFCIMYQMKQYWSAKFEILHLVNNANILQQINKRNICLNSWLGNFKKTFSKLIFFTIFRNNSTVLLLCSNFTIIHSHLLKYQTLLHDIPFKCVDTIPITHCSFCVKIFSP